MKNKYTRRLALAVLALTGITQAAPPLAVQQARHAKVSALVATNDATAFHRYKYLLLTKVRTAETRAALKAALKDNPTWWRVNMLEVSAGFITQEGQGRASVAETIAALDAVPVPAEEAAHGNKVRLDMKSEVYRAAGDYTTQEALLRAYITPNSSLDIATAIMHSLMDQGKTTEAREWAGSVLLSAREVGKDLQRVRILYTAYKMGYPMVAEHRKILDRLTQSVPITEDTKSWLGQLWSRKLLLDSEGAQ